jgi:hypothetical protein
VLNAWPCCLHTDAVATVFAIAWDAQGIYRPGPVSLYANGGLMLRVTFPFGLWLHIKPWRDRRVQLGAGWKLNGRLGLIARAQTDAAAAAGTHGPNVDQASAWERGSA